MSRIGIKSLIVGCSVMVLTACGGGGSSSTNQVTPPVQNSAPIAMLKSSVSIVTEGQMFSLDASESSDVNGDTLSYSWSQISGPNITLPSTQLSSLDLVAPVLEHDETLEFQVAVSDGELSNTATVSVDVDDLKPVQTLSKPSPFYNGDTLDDIADLVSNDDGYTVFWYGDFEDDARATSSQLYSADGVVLGEQIDGQIFVGPNVEGVDIFNILKRGESVLYNLIAYDLSSNQYSRVISYNATVLGLVDGIATITGREFGRGQHLTSYGAASEVGTNKIAVANTLQETDSLKTITFDDGRQASLFYHRVEAHIIEDSGTAVSTVLSESDEKLKAWADLTALDDNTYIATWVQVEIPDELTTNIYGQRASLDGTLIGDAFTINEQVDASKLPPRIARFSNGNILVTWSDFNGGGSSNDPIVKGRILNSQMGFVTSEFEISAEENTSQYYSHSTALANDKILVSWISSSSENDEVRAIVIGSDGSFASNEFIIASGEEALDVQSIKSTVLNDQKVVFGWSADDIDDPSENIIYTLGFYPFGKEN